MATATFYNVHVKLPPCAVCGAPALQSIYRDNKEDEHLNEGWRVFCPRGCDVHCYTRRQVKESGGDSEGNGHMRFAQAAWIAEQRDRAQIIAGTR